MIQEGIVSFIDHPPGWPTECGAWPVSGWPAGSVLPWSGFFFDLKFISVLPHLISNRSPLALGNISYRLRLLMKPSGA